MYRQGQKKENKTFKTHFGQNTKILVPETVEYEMNGNIMGVGPGCTQERQSSANTSEIVNQPESATEQTKSCVSMTTTRARGNHWDHSFPSI